MPKRNGERWTCSCGATLVSAQTKAGRQAPITTEPKPDGNVLLFRSSEKTDDRGQPILECRNLGDESVLAYLREQGVPLRLNHFADCPHFNRYGKGAKR